MPNHCQPIVPAAARQRSGRGRLGSFVRRLVVLVGAVLVLPLTSVERAAAAVAVPDLCLELRAFSESLGTDAQDVRDGRVTFYGASTQVRPTTDFSRPPALGAAWRIAYASLVWLTPLAVEAFETGNESDKSLVAAYVDGFWRTNKDPGSRTAAALARANAAGWGEGPTKKRQTTLNCLVQLQPDASMRALLDASINAGLDPKRYYGLPLFRPHNHGLLSNLAMLDSARILDRPQLAAAARDRLLADVAVVRDVCGMVYEQSATYQRANAQLWRKAAAALADAGSAHVAAQLASEADRMWAAFKLLVTPEGTIAPVGDSNPTPGGEIAAGGATRLLCRSAGWAAARTDWTPNATHFTLRFGPRTRMHGHHDHGSVTWAVGYNVLTDPGYYFLGDLRPDLARYAKSNAAHNVLGVSGVEFSAPTDLLRAKWGTMADVFTVRDQAVGATRARSVWVDRGLPLLIALDRATATVTRRFTQRWHLPDGWRGTATPGIATKGDAVVGFVAIDLSTGRPMARHTGRAYLFPTGRSVTKGYVHWTSKDARSVSILTVVFTTSSRLRPRVTWTPGSRTATGTVRVQWGRHTRLIRVDATGFISP